MPYNLDSVCATSAESPSVRLTKTTCTPKKADRFREQMSAVCGCVEGLADSSGILLPGALPAQLRCISHRHLSTLQVRPLAEGKAGSWYQ